MIMIMMMNMSHCVRCGYEWERRVEGRPKNCPRCKSPLWDRPKVSMAKMSKANAAVAKAKSKGILIPQPCSICGAMDKIQAHHENYDEPLEVTWYCPKHHRLRHEEIGDALVDMQSGDSRHISIRIPDELLEIIDSEAKRRRWSRHAAIITCIEFGLPDLERETVGRMNGENKSEAVAKKVGEAGSENGSAGIKGDQVGGKGRDTGSHETAQGEVELNAKIATGGSAGVEKDTVLPKGERGVRKGAAYVNRELLRGKSISEVVAVGTGAGFRGPGKCPHGWKDWMTCRNNG